MGTIYGTATASGTYEFLGIPFAKARRFAPPAPLANTSFPGKQFDATSFGRCCLQLPTETYIPCEWARWRGVMTQREFRYQVDFSRRTIDSLVPVRAFCSAQDEECLSLNIFTPASLHHALLPVMVWIHGGGAQFGCSAQSLPALYNGSNIIANAPASTPVIVVSINYRCAVVATPVPHLCLPSNRSHPISFVRFWCIGRTV